MKLLLRIALLFLLPRRFEQEVNERFSRFGCEAALHRASVPACRSPGPHGQVASAEGGHGQLASTQYTYGSDVPGEGRK